MSDSEVVMRVIGEYAVPVNYDLSSYDILVRGCYRDAAVTNYQNIWRKKGRSQEEVVLVEFDREIHTNEVCRILEEKCYRPAVLHELGAFVEHHKSVARECLTVALGSVWVHPSYRCHIVSCFDDSRLCSKDQNSHWYAGTRFAVVHSIAELLI